MHDDGDDDNVDHADDHDDSDDHNDYDGPHDHVEYDDNGEHGEHADDHVEHHHGREHDHADGDHVVNADAGSEAADEGTSRQAATGTSHGAVQAANGATDQTEAAEASARGVHEMTPLATIASAVALVLSHGAPSVFPDGAPFGTIRVPSIGLTTPTFEGSMEMYSGRTEYLPELKHGPAHYPANALPWQQGTAAFAGHRITNSRPFWDLGNVRLGAAFVVRTGWGDYWYKVVPPPKGHGYDRSGYPIRNSPCVLRNACGVVWKKTGWFFRWHTKGHWAVATACTPKGDDQQRLVVFLKLVAVSDLPRFSVKAKVLASSTKGAK